MSRGLKATICVTLLAAIAFPVLIKGCQCVESARSTCPEYCSEPALSFEGELEVDTWVCGEKPCVVCTERVWRWPL